ncbi:MAG TPA: hypothetical protein VNA57_07755 [Acidimicrobiales bacterium]|nr:hypothetical protein [Acidimicrobiales bacterium]
MIPVKALAISLFVFIIVMLLTGDAVGAGEIVLAAVLAVFSGVVYPKRTTAAR